MRTIKIYNESGKPVITIVVPDTYEVTIITEHEQQSTELSASSAPEEKTTITPPVRPSRATDETTMIVHQVQQIRREVEEEMARAAQGVAEAEQRERKEAAPSDRAEDIVDELLMKEFEAARAEMGSRSSERKEGEKSIDDIARDQLKEILEYSG